MHRTPRLLLVAAIGLLAANASANYTIDLIWSDTGTATLTLSPGDPSVGPVGGACAGGFLYDGSATGRCLEVRLTATAPLTAALVTLGWNTAASGLQVDHVGLKSHGIYGASGFAGASPTQPTVAGTANCAGLGCDTAFGSFGGVTGAPLVAGSYTIGSINFDTSGTLVGVHNILVFLRTGIDGVTDRKFNVVPVQLNGALISDAIPEPGTASLLGLGVLGLCAIARRRR